MDYRMFFGEIIAQIYSIHDYLFRRGFHRIGKKLIDRFGPAKNFF